MVSLREQKEAFVSGHAGTSLGEVSAIAAAPVLLLLLWRLLRHPAAVGGGLFHTPRPTAAGLALEFAVLVLPLGATLLGFVQPGTLLGGAGALALALALTQDGEERQHRGRTGRRTPLPDLLRGALSSYRASLALATLAAILGVDFPAFPRRYAKAEAYGTGLMDAGVGSFVAASGLAHGLSAAARAGAGGGSSGRGGKRGGGAAVGAWRREAVRAAVLLALGAARLLATRAADYQHHASEYGLHWNFFLTLGALRAAGLLLPRRAQCGAGAAGVGAALLAAHQWALSARGLIGVVHSEERGPGLLSANKEGLLSLPGYWALQLLSTAAGHAAYHLAVAAAAAAARSRPRPATRSSSVSTSATDNGSSSAGGGLRIRTRLPLAAPRGPPLLRLAGGLAAGAAALWAAYWATATWVQPVSRRACNAPYVLWMLALNIQTLALFVGADAAVPGASPHLLAAAAGAMLPLFLAGNLLTGLVNLSMNTLAASDATAAAVLAAYLAVLCGGAAAWALRPWARGAATPRRAAF